MPVTEVDFQALEGTGENYVYALSRTTASEDNDPNNIFYIGKGIRRRWEQHFAETRAKMAREDAGEEIVYSETHKVIRDLSRTKGSDLNPEDHTYIVARQLPEPTSFQVESILIKLFRQFGVQLTNEKAGHYQAELLVPASEVRRFMEIERLNVPAIAAHELERYLPGEVHANRGVCVLVKGSSYDMPYLEDRIEDTPGRFAGSVQAQADSINVEDATLRRGWDPHQPWTDEEARERARHYWPIRAGNAGILRAIAEDGRLQLALGISDPRTGETVVRYTWNVTVDKPWLDYGGTIGFELGKPFDEKLHPFLGKCLINQATGRQPLNASGIGYLEFELP